MSNSNPYTLVFGQPPLELIERSAQAERIISEFKQERPANSINLITGVRGCGKTVFVTGIADRLRSKEWIIINLNAQRDLLQSLAAKLNSDRKLNQLFRNAEINLQAFGIGVGISGIPPIDDIEEALIRMLRSIKKQHQRVLITIDEATNTNDMRVFASAYQIFLREQLPVFLLMTGLYKNIDSLRNADGMTFLERAPRTVLAPLNQQAMTQKYMETLQIRQDEAARLSKATKGYSFAFQTIGYFYWENPMDPQKAMANAMDYLEEFAYRKIWSELSRKDKEVVLAVSKVKNGEIMRIREVLHYSTNQFNPYRNRLIKAGIICSPLNGIVEFALPGFGEFAERVTEEGSI
ncbi:MAG: ATP-binding protein [Eubacterium sp.]|nr:ATP-binding protein [Eubacterium sp.]